MIGSIHSVHQAAFVGLRLNSDQSRRINSSTITKPVDESRIETVDQEFESSTGKIENDYFDKRVGIKTF
jgi:uncharacterized protein YlbG (UPF0298 family)